GPVLDHHDVGLEIPHATQDSEVMTLSVDLQDADASRNLTCADQRLERAPSDGHSFAPCDLIRVCPLEQGVAKGQRRPVRVARDMKSRIAIVVADSMPVHDYTRVAGELRAQDLNIARARLESMNELDAGGDHRLDQA